ncbi:hypothetical protein JS531_09105 [Bifidobacterium sp. CP2]|uniref:hypothetical protein n=1 Tax=Bifidobacterium sp. CP2 TaxID=2809025 RepID=UPI001BDD0103|nr:hypothetical protein [Bifidobacterium sp. CP2]MBT1182099.1 hypothetical protein [Bifidobacterium sp. CP2]
MKKTIAIVASIAMLAGLTACGDTDTTASTPAKSESSSKTQETPKPQPADLTGIWKQTNSNSNDSYMQAEITDGSIQVYFVGTDAKSLYWKGTYEAPTEAGDWKWTSQGDSAAMSSSLLGSQDSTKDFTYSEADGVSWQTTMMGTTVTVKTQKQ